MNGTMTFAATRTKTNPETIHCSIKKVKLRGFRHDALTICDLSYFETTDIFKEYRRACCYINEEKLVQVSIRSNEPIQSVRQCVADMKLELEVAYSVEVELSGYC